jgi:flagellar hook assembly protein FlgD
VAYPNPFNAETSFHFELQRQEKVRIDIFDIRGRVVKHLANGFFEKGLNSIDWDGRHTNGDPVSSGSYFVRGVFGEQIQTTKISLLK